MKCVRFDEYLVLACVQEAIIFANLDHSRLCSLVGRALHQPRDGIFKHACKFILVSLKRLNSKFSVRVAKTEDRL